MTRAAVLSFAVAVVAAAPLAAQEIYQAVVLELAVPEVHVIVARAHGDERVQCLLRDTTGRIRIAGTQPISTGLASGGTTILTIPLPLLDPGETEFAVTLLRGSTEIHRTEWRPLFRTSAR